MCPGTTAYAKTTLSANAGMAVYSKNMISRDEIKTARETLKRARAERSVAGITKGSDIIGAPYLTADGRERVTLLIPAALLASARRKAAERGVSTYAIVRDNLPWICTKIEANYLTEYAGGKWVRYGVPSRSAEQVPARFKTQAEETQAAPEPASG